MADGKTYGLAKTFERICAQLSATSRNFWGRIGEHLDPDKITDETSQLVLRACKALATDNGRAPDMPSVVLQRIQRWHDEGRVSYDALEAAEGLVFEAMAGMKHVDENSVISELIPMVRRILEREALEKGLDSYGKKKQLGTVALMLEKAYRIGLVDTAPGMTLNAGAVDKVVQLKNLKRLGTGIPELDGELGGGMPRGCLGVVLGPAKAGKSMMLCHIAAHALVTGVKVAYATLEIADAYIMARIIANLTDLSSEAIIDDLTAGTAKERLQHLTDSGLLPYCTVKYFPPEVSSMNDIREWVDREEQAIGDEIPAVCTDYIQLVGVSGAVKSMPGHEKKKLVAEQHRAYAADRNKWVFSGAQPQRNNNKPGTKKTLISLEDVADGMYITRTADLAISINPQDEGMLYYIAGFRYGRDKQSVGPFKTYFDYGRMSHVHRPGWPYWCEADDDLLV